jgi:hypothetical protein
MNTVLDLLQSRKMPSPPSWLRKQAKISHEELYMELVRLEAEGLAGFYANHFDGDGRAFEAGWYAIKPRTQG